MKERPVTNEGGAPFDSFRCKKGQSPGNFSLTHDGQFRRRMCRFRRRVSIRPIRTTFRVRKRNDKPVKDARMRLDRASIREFVTLLMPGFGAGW